MKVALTGNPFVDIGYFVIASKMQVEQPEDVSWDDIEGLYGDGLELATANARLTGFTMVFGTNGPLTQPAYRPSKQKKVISETNIRAYTNVLSALLREATQEDTNQPVCEICGLSHTFDFDHTIRNALTTAGVKDPGKKQIGRDWFPLAGSPGNDAQALPGGSRGLHICAKCLFAVHYMPLGLMLVNGKLACFQSNPPVMAMEITGDIAKDYESRLSASSDKIELIGKKEATTALTRRLLSWMHKRAATKRNHNLQTVSLTVWLFSNSGDGADCALLQVPNQSMQFLWRVEREGLNHDLEILLAGESKRPDDQFLTRTQDGRDYARLYPHGTFRGASSNLFALYHQLILKETPQSLSVASTLAHQYLNTGTPKERKSLTKSDILTGKDSKRHQARIRKRMLEIAITEEFLLDHYWELFPIERIHPIRNSWRGWKTIGYYLVNSESGEIPDFSSAPEMKAVMEPSRHTDMKPRSDILRIAQLYFDDFIHEKGSTRFRRDIIEGFEKRHGNGLAWMREIFLKFATKESGFTIADWDEFLLDEEGRPQPHDLVFQLRLALSNLYREHVNQLQE